MNNRGKSSSKQGEDIVSIGDAVLMEDEVAVLNSIERVITAWANNDADAFADAHTEDATIVTVEGLYCKGREPIRGLMTMLYAGPFRGTKVYWELEDVRFVGSDVAVVIYWNGIGKARTREELPPEETRRATTVVARQPDGEWLVSAFQNAFITEPKTETATSL
jgi:uncharacterized protein (TIGR02246 family)